MICIELAFLCSNVKFLPNVTKLLSKSFFIVNNYIHLLCNYEYLKTYTMKKYVLMASLLVSGLSFAQEINPKLEEVDGLVKATYYYDNGVVQQQGFFKDGKLDGKWVSFDESGNKKAEAQYSNGEKVGKWMFWNQDNSVAIVEYSERVIKTKDALADKN